MFIDFIRENYRLIIDLFAILFAIILLVVSKKSIKDILSYIYGFAVKAILSAEESGLKGNEKLAFAVKLVKDDLIKTFPKIDVSRYTSIITYVIEEMLLTPQKKKED